MKYIKLVENKVAVVDDEDFDFLNKWKWCINSRGYIVRSKHISGSGKNRKRISILMHRLLNKTPSGFHTDHINGNKLDNQKKNLRTLTASRNVFYSGMRKNNTSGYKGVYWDKSRKSWHAHICRDRKVFFLGRFNNLLEATRSRKIAEKQLWS